MSIRLWGAAAALVALALGGPALAGEHKPLELTPQHKALHRCAGEWKAVVKHYDPSGKTMTMTGKQTCRVLLDGRAIHYEYAQDDGSFKGFGGATWNVVKKKYQSWWLDTMSPGGLAIGWGTYDPAKKTMTEEMASVGPDGKTYKSRNVTVYESNDKMVMTLYVKGPDGKERTMMEITYTRIK